jgi:hypothetical protein
VLRQVAWASVPVWSIGFLSFVPFGAYALSTRRPRDWAVFGGYLAATIAMIVALGVISASSGADGALGGFIIALAGCAAVHTAVLFRPGRGPQGLAPGAPTGPKPLNPKPLNPKPLNPEQRNRDSVAEARSRIERRVQARRLAESNPTLARELRIGRPDLIRNYDDGGLVDVNHMPGPALAHLLGLTPAEAADVLGARERIGRFTSADELCAYTSLAPDRVDELRDLMLFG